MGGHPRLRELWDGPLVVKGILRADDARRAVAEGVDAIVVSNDGGNYLDGSMPSLRALPEIVAAVGDEIEVLFDSGVRRGIDVVRALALGARTVMLGRGYVWAHLAAGEAGVRHILELFRQQVDDCLAYLGARSLDELDPSLLDIGGAANVPAKRHGQVTGAAELGSWTTRGGGMVSARSPGLMAARSAGSPARGGSGAAVAYSSAWSS